MQQWIPKGHTLEPKIWGEIGLRQGLYVGLGIFLGAMLFLLLSRFGLWVRVGVLVLPPCVGLVVGFMRIKGLTPEAYLLHSLRFRLRRAGTLGVWDTGAPLGAPAELWVGEVPAGKPEPVRSKPKPAERTPSRSEPARVNVRRAPAVPVAYLMDVGPFGPAFPLAALALAGAVLSFAIVRHMYP